MSPTNSDDATSKAVIVRIALFFYLFAATIAAGTASYILLNNYESKLQYADYDSKVHSYGTHILNNLYLSAMTSKLLMEAASFGCPHADMWPNCSALSMEYYSNFTKVLVDISKKNSISINPIITKEQIGGFESFAYDYFDQQGYGVDGPHYTLGMSSGLGKGIFARNSSGLYKSVDYYPYGENEILAPVFLASNLEVNRNAVMFNVYSETLRVRAIDNLLRCVHESGSHIDCAAITGIIDLIQMDGYSPAALVFSPITPYHNESTVVALVVAVFNWENMLNDKKSSLSNVVVILNYLDVSYTFCIMSGIATLLGRGDLHDQAFNEYREEFKVDSFPATDESYVIQVYPTAAYTDSNRSDAPVYGSVLVVSLIVFTSAFVYLYDRVINKITRERQIVLETKRMFVRYISHEIRTPLNTVKIGLSLLKRELHQLIASLKVITDKDMKMAGEMFNKINKETLASAKYWVELIKDISVSSDVAVTVLNDLINYDKIVMGSIQLEISMVGIWELVIEITKPFYVHAKEKNIGFKVQSSGGVLEIFGDDWRGGKVDSSIRKSKNQLKSWPAHAADSVSSEQSISSSIHGRFSYGMDDTISRKVVLIPDGNSGMPPNMFNILTSLTIAADKTKIGQVIRNLVSNALKFTTSGDVTIAVTWNRQPPTLFENSGNLFVEALKQVYFVVGTISISVTDSGVGMTKQNLQELFQEGKQFNANQLQNGEGSGLGLWVSKGFIEQHNGTITARSEGENKGSTFIVELPVMQKCADFVPSNDDETSFQMKHCDMNKKNRAVSKVAPDIEQGFSDMSNVPNYKHNIDDTPPVGNGCSARSVEVTLDKIATDQMRAPALVRILVVDDAVTNRKIICRMLESYGYIVEQAINGKEAIDRIKQNAMGFDLILMDFEMPLMNGPSATRIIREELSLNVPIFGLTGNVLEEDVRYFMDSGANVVLHKPLSYPQLGAEMKKYVEKLKNVSEDEEY